MARITPKGFWNAVVCIIWMICFYFYIVCMMMWEGLCKLIKGWFK